MLRKHWPAHDPAYEGPLTGARLADRRLAGVPLRSLAAGSVITESASRSASRVVRLLPNRVARTSVTPLGPRAWEDLPAAVTARGLAALDRQLAELPPRLIRPRVEAELVRAVPIAEVRAVGYDPGDQRLDAVIADAEGTTATVSATYHAAGPAALDSLADALSGTYGTPRFVSGSVHRATGGITVRPLAVLTDEGPVLPDLAPGDGDTALATSPQDATDPEDALAHAVRGALAVCAEAAHQGLGHLAPGVRTRLADTVAALSAVGLRTTAGLLASLASASAADDPERSAATWVAAQIRLLTLAESS